MTDIQKIKLEELQKQGKSYRFIADALDLPINTIKAWVRRHPVSEFVCLQCGISIQQTPHSRLKKFCSNKCRGKWWSAHPEERTSQMPYKHTCNNCGVVFFTNRKASKYCSTQCYAKSLRKDDSNG